MNEKENKLMNNLNNTNNQENSTLSKNSQKNKKEHFKLSLRKYSDSSTVDTNNIYPYHSLQLENLNFHTSQNSQKIRKNFNFSNLENSTNDDDDFQIISKDDIITNQSIRNSSHSEDNLCMSKSYSLSPIKKKTILANSIKVDQGDFSENKLNSSYWSYFTNGLSKFTNTLKYNIITTNSYVNFQNLKFLRFFDKIFKEEEIKLLHDSSSEISYYMSKIFQFTYRSDFAAIKYQGVEYTSDCGWGCMIRAAQMMLSKFILENKIYRRENFQKIPEEEMNRLKFETLLLFLDNNVKIEEILENEDFKFFFENFQNVINEQDKERERENILKQSISICEKESNENSSKNKNKNNESSSDKILTSYEYYLLQESNKNNSYYENKFQNTNSANNTNINVNNPLLYISEITPPFSIQNICKLGENFDKGAGIWFSDVIMSSIFCQINRELKPVKDIEFIHFKEGIINEEFFFSRNIQDNDIDNEVKNNLEIFEELHCREDCINNKENIPNSNNESYSEKEIEKMINNLSLEKNKLLSSICEDCINFYLTNPTTSPHILKKENKLFLFKHGGLIFISVRLGLDSISKEYYESIRHIFKIPQNLGIIGGKKNSALFFIGEHSEKDKLIYLDPHVNQKAVKDSHSLLIESEFHSYSPKYFYNVNIANMSPAFTTAFYFRSLEEYVDLIKHLEIHSSFNYPVFKFKKKEENLMKKKSSLTMNVKVLEDINEEEDYCIVEYDDLNDMDMEENF
jgi:hypothetical protein